VPKPVSKSVAIGVFRRLFPGARLAPLALSVALLLTLVALAVDYSVVPSLYSSSPLWSAALVLLLLLRRDLPRSGASPPSLGTAPPAWRVGLFALAHLLIVLTARAAGASFFQGWPGAASKLAVLFPLLLLLPPQSWLPLARAYRPEFTAGLLALFTAFPFRLYAALWPWYGAILGRFVFALSRPFVPSLGYSAGLTPTLLGPDLDVTIITECGGLNGIYLFQYLFAFVLFLDWSRLHKRRTCFAYFAAIPAMLLANAVRIAALVSLGNRGYADAVSRFHISAGWPFFSAAALLFLSLSYRWMLLPRTPPPE
jgi:exosortase/archaeosortase family protein